MVNDVVIIGAGLAGMVAAVRASELGLTPMVLEAGADAGYMCNSRITGGIFHIAMNSILLDSTEAQRNIEAVTGGYADPALSAVLAKNGRRAVDWLRAQGVRFIKAGPAPEFSTVLAPPMLQQFGMHWRGRGGDVLLRTLADRLRERGGAVVYGTRAHSLLMEKGHCVGVEAQSNGAPVRIPAHAVIIADGGFQADASLVGTHISPAPHKLRQRNAQTGRGDGLRMAVQAGASLVGLDRFYGHVLHRDAMFNDRLWPHPMVDSMAVSGVIVGADGRRFTDEGLGGVSIANALARQEDPLSAFVICDDSAWQGPARAAVLAPNPNLTKAGARVVEAADLTELAAELGISPKQLAATVDDYNAAAASGSLGRLTPARTTERWPARLITQPPFHGVPVCAGITYTMGGIAIDSFARVLGEHARPIPGLYAAGATTGGLEGGPLSGYTGGLSKASVFGLVAAESASEALKSMPRAPAGGGHLDGR